MILSSIYFWNTGKTYDERKNAMLNFIKSLKIDKEELEDFLDRSGYDEEELEQDIDEDEYIRKILIDCIENVFSSLNSREVSCINIPFGEIYITGGMSWGDYPTDSCVNFELFYNLPQDILSIGDCCFLNSDIDIIDVIIKYGNFTKVTNKCLMNEKTLRKL